MSLIHRDTKCSLHVNRLMTKITVIVFAIKLNNIN